MNYCLLVRDKKILPTLTCTINQGEHNADNLKIIVPDIYSDLLPTLQIILPNNKGKIKACQFQDEIYKDNWRIIELPITSTITSLAGTVQLWFTFFDVASEEKTVKTDIGYINIKEHKGFSESVGDDDFQDVAQAIAELKTDVKILSQSKADSVSLDVDTNILSLKSGDVKLSSIILPDDITWELLD